MELVKRNWYRIFVLAILLIAIFLRFYNYLGRWGLAYDQSQFAILSRYAVKSSQLPLLGPFSSGGPFQTGGEWYWIVMMGTKLYPSSILSPWIFLTFLTVVAVALMIYLGQLLYNKTFGIILGCLIAVSQSQIVQSTNLTNHNPIILFSVLALVGMVRFVNNKSLGNLFLMCISIGIATSIHIQAVALFPLIFWTIIVTKSFKAKYFGVIFLSILIPWIPVLVADLGNNFYNTISMLTYTSSDQAKVPYEVLGRRWLTFLGITMPEVWARVIGGYTVWGYILIALSSISILYLFSKKVLKKEWYIIVLSALCMVVIVRYIRTPIYPSFLIFLNPYIYLLTSIVIYSLYRFKKVLGVLFLLIILTTSIVYVWKDIVTAENRSYKTAKLWRDQLVERYPEEKFSLYDFELLNTDKTFPFVLVLETENLIDNNGIKIGIANASSGAQFRDWAKVVFGEVESHQAFLLDSSTILELESTGWRRIDPEVIYGSVQNWYK